MPVYEGQTLASRLQRGTLGLREACETFVPIARSLEALHRAGLRHQDLKPDNIFLAEFAGRIHPIILDLGVAAECTSQFVAGTILFAAPEQTLALTGGQDELPLPEREDGHLRAGGNVAAFAFARGHGVLPRCERRNPGGDGSRPAAAS